MKTLLKRIFKKEPDIYGFWSTAHNDGGFGMISGSELMLNKDGSGTLRDWGWGQDEPYDIIQDVQWKKNGEGVLDIKHSGDECFTSVSYVIEEIKDAYGVRYYELYQPGYKLGENITKGFWSVPDSLLRPV